MGKKVVRERKILDVNIQKGMKDGQKITFEGEGDQVYTFVVLYILVYIVHSHACRKLVCVYNASQYCDRVYLKIYFIDL